MIINQGNSWKSKTNVTVIVNQNVGCNYIKIFYRNSKHELKLITL